MLGADDSAEVGHRRGGRRLVSIAEGDGSMDVEKFADFSGNGEVEIKKMFPVGIEEGTQIVCVVVEERAFAIGRAKGIPMDVSPVPVVADTDVSDEGFIFGTVTLQDWHGERLGAIGCGYDAPVSVGLLLEMLVLLNNAQAVTVQFLIPLNRPEIGG